MTSNIKEPTRPIGDAVPAPDGTLRAKTTLTPKACRVRARLGVPPSLVMPIVVVPGIMGTNLRASTKEGVDNQLLKHGEIAWRAPNETVEALRLAREWRRREPADRQKILDQSTLEVDPDGPLPLPGQIGQLGVSAEQLRARGWGEIHWGSYGKLLFELVTHFRAFVTSSDGEITPAAGWRRVNSFDRARWGAEAEPALAPFSTEDLSYIARRGYPVYAFGYNWLCSNAESADRLTDRIDTIINWWKRAGFQCEQVILVTHSMGGLVARACAKNIPEKIAGIVHGCMPALGAPVCYRRLACGVEVASPSNDKLDNLTMETVAGIVGRTAAETTPTMAFSAGALELLPTHLYPQPWLYVARPTDKNQYENVLCLPEGNPYMLYRDLKVWYRAINPDLADPAGIRQGRVADGIMKALKKAEAFHRQRLGDYFHPNTYVFYGSDTRKLTYGSFRWIGDPERTASTWTLQNATCVSDTFHGGRNVALSSGQVLFFAPGLQDVRGDGTVPVQSGFAARKFVKAAFATTGYGHQGSYSDEAMRTLTIHLVARLARES